MIIIALVFFKKVKEKHIKMNPANYSEQLQSIYRNILLHQQSFAYANIMAAMSSTPPPPQIKVEPVTPAEIHLESPTQTPIFQSQLSPSSFSLDSEIPREEIEGDIEVIMVKSFLDNLKKIDTSLNGLRGKKFGFREICELTQIRPTYPNLNSSMKRNRTSSFGSASTSTERASFDEEKEFKKTKVDLNESACSSDDGRLIIDWSEEPSEISKQKIQKVIKTEPQVTQKGDDDDYKPWQLRFERLKQIQKKKPRFSIDNLDLTYHGKQN